MMVQHGQLTRATCLKQSTQYQQLLDNTQRKHKAVVKMDFSKWFAFLFQDFKID